MTTHREGIDRRSFLKLAATTPAFALGGCAPGDEPLPAVGDAEMRYRPLGGTGLEVSEVTFGAHGVDNAALMAAALDAGINTFATSGSYLDGREEEALGQAVAKIGSRRDQLVLLTGEVVGAGASKQSVLDAIDASLRRLRTDHIDVYTTAMVQTPADLRVDALFDAFDAARRAGKVGHLALSSHHGGMQDCLEAALLDGRFEVFFIKYDFVSYPDLDRILQRAAKQGIGTMAFKTGAGNRHKEIEDLEAGGLSFPQASLKWALTNPDVSSVAVTITNFDQIGKCRAAVASRLSGRESEMLRRYAERMHDRYCRFCGQCEASCPRGVALADVNRFAMYFKHYGREKEAIQHYGTLPRRRSAASCHQCPGACDAACPFGRPVRAELVEAHRLLSLRQA